MEGQPLGEIWVPIGREGVVAEVLVTGMELEMLRGKRGRPEAPSGGAVPVNRVAGREVEFRVGNGGRMGKFTPVGTGGLPDVGKVLFVAFRVGKGKNPVAGNGNLPVAFK